jgi:hypothetical protein
MRFKDTTLQMTSLYGNSNTSNIDSNYIAGAGQPGIPQRLFTNADNDDFDNYRY